MYDGGGYPVCMGYADQYLREDRAWVGCLCRDDGVQVLASPATRAELAANPGTWGYLHPNCPPKERVAFLLGGLRMLEAEAATA